jgi:tetratricopeptide (TPR) repeat protein
LWRKTRGTALAREFMAKSSLLPGTDQVTRVACTFLKSDADSFGGRSGSAVLDAAGAVVAVMQGRDHKERTCVIDLPELRKFLQEAEPYLEARTVDEIQRRGRLYLQQGRLAMADKDFREVWQRRAEKPESAEEGLLDLAAVTRAQNLFEESLEWCEKALATPGRRPGRAYAERAATRLAELPHPAFHPVKRKLPRFKSLFGAGKEDPEFQRGLVEAQKKRDAFWAPRKQAVLDDVSAALKEDPKSWLAYQTRANLLRRLPNPDHEQILADRTAVVKLRNNVLRRDAASLLERARAYYEAGDYAKSFADCEAVLRMEPRSSVARVWQCRNALASNLPAEAYVIAVRLVAMHTDAAGTHEPLEPHHPVNCELVADLARIAGKWAEAQDALSGAILWTEKLSLPAKRRHYVDRGDVYVKLKEFAKARADYQKALGITDPLADSQPDSREVLAYQRKYSIEVIRQKIKNLSVTPE